MAGSDNSDKFAHHARAVAIELHGDPNKQLSSQKELRFGTQGSLSVDLEKGTFFDHQEGEGGGVLWAIARETGKAGASAVEWMRDRGFDVEDDRPHRPASSGGSAASSGPRLDPAGNWLPQRVPDHGKLTKTYNYEDAEGVLKYQVCRFDWEVDASVNAKGHDKTFVQRVPDQSKAGGWAYSTKGMTWLPYRLPELLEDIASGYPIYIVEGEKKVDMLREIGVPATCNHGGAGKFPEDLVAHFKGAKVVILPDNDGPGKEHANLIGRRLEGVAASIQTLDLPGLPAKGGIDDWLPEGGSAEKLYDLVDSHAQPFEAAPFQSKFEAVEWHNLDAPGPEYEYLVEDVLTENEISMLLGESQGGKSFLAIDIAMAVARGVPFSGNKVRQGAVIYQAGESATGVRRKRLPAYRIGHEVKEPRLPFTLLQGPLDLYSGDDPTEAFIDECLYWGRRGSHPLKLIIIDTFSKATAGANENDGKDMGLVLSRCDLIRRKTGAHVMLVHHLNAGGTKARGHTSLFANVENVITVRKVEDAHDQDGRQIREWKIAKQKDGEDGGVTKFVLRGVDIGTRPDGKKLFSCIVAPPGNPTGASAPAEAGLTVGGSHAPILRAIYTAIKTKGVLAPAELGLAAGATAVTRKDLWSVIRGATQNVDGGNVELKDGETLEDAQKRAYDAQRQAVKRAMDALYAKAITGAKDDWVWLTGAKRVKGFEVPPGLGDAEADVRKRYGKRSTGNGGDDKEEDLSEGYGDRPTDVDLPF
jgi:hypothetical protein